MMKIKYEITIKPKDEKYLVAYLEGILKIYINGALFLNVENILIVEFAIALKKWIIQIGEINMFDFSYESMDSDEQGIFELEFDGNKGFFPKSIWQEFQTNEPISKDVLFKEIETFLININNDLRRMYNVEIEMFMK